MQTGFGLFCISSWLSQSYCSSSNLPIYTCMGIFHLGRVGAIQHDEMPACQVEAVVAPGQVECLDGHILSKQRVVGDIWVCILVTPAPDIVVADAMVDG